MSTTSIKLTRLTVAVISVFIVSDLYPHPSLPPGIIETSLTKIQQQIVAPSSH